MTQTAIADVLDFLADRIDWTLGNPNGGETVEGVESLTPGRAGSLSFFKLEDELAQERIGSSSSRFVLVRSSLDRDVDFPGKVLIAVGDPRREFVRATRKFFHPDPPSIGIHPTAVVAVGASYGSDCEIGPGAFLQEGVSLGDRCRIGANAVLLRGTRVGNDVSIGPNCTIGGTGFGYVREDDGEPILVPHIGGVEIQDGVQIGGNTTIDRGSLEDTVIRRAAKIDNLVQIAHNCDIGEGAFVIATASVSGSVRVGPRAWISPNSTIKQHLTIGEGATVGMGAAVLRDVPESHTVFGMPARTISKGDA